MYNKQDSFELHPISKISNIPLPSRLYSSKNELNIAGTDHRRDKAADFHTAVVGIAAVDTAVVVYADAAVDTGAAADSLGVARLDRAIPAAEHKLGVGGDLVVEAVEAAESFGMAGYHWARSLPLRSFAWPKNPVTVHRFHRFLVSPSFAP